MFGYPPLYVLATIACAFVLVVLLVGVASFAIGGEFNRKYSNKIMRLRVGSQLIAIVLIVAAVYVGKG